MLSHWLGVDVLYRTSYRRTTCIKYREKNSTITCYRHFIHGSVWVSCFHLLYFIYSYFLLSKQINKQIKKIKKNYWWCYWFWRIRTSVISSIIKCYRHFIHGSVRVSCFHLMYFIYSYFLLSKKLISKQINENHS